MSFTDFADRWPLPCHVRWNGWTSDTYTLKRNGWHVYGDSRQCLHSDRLELTLGIKSPENDLVVLGRTFLPRKLFYTNSVQEVLRQGVQMQQYTIRSTYVPTELNVGWVAADSMTENDGLLYIPREPVVRDLSELKLFDNSQECREIIVPPSSVDECLNRILELQYPEQQLIKQASSGAKEKPIVSAKIYQLAV